MVQRGNATEGARIQPYEMNFELGQSLLDLLLELRIQTDPSLAVRYSCRANACKECSALINGQVGYLCCEKAADGAVVEIRPLPKRRWIRDLVTDLN